MKLKTIVATSALITIALSTASAVSMSYTAQQGTGIGDFNTQNPLSGTTVQLGVWDGGSFSVLDSSLSADGGNPAGLFGGNVLFESTSLAAAQPAMRIFDVTGTAAVIAYTTDWFFAAGDGTGTDTGTQFIDLADVIAFGGTPTANAQFFADPNLAPALVGIGGVNPSFGSPMLLVSAVPEPSTYAMLAGALALVAVMIRRRK